MSNLLSKINEDLLNSVKERNEVRVSTLRFLISKFNNARIAKGGDLDDSEIEAEIAKEAKRHQESIAAYVSAKRDDLVKKEGDELSILREYLPESVSDEDLVGVIDEVITSLGAKSAADMGSVMKAVREKVGPGADGAKIAEIVRGKLKL